MQALHEQIRNLPDTTMRICADGDVFDYELREAINLR